MDFYDLEAGMVVQDLTGKEMTVIGWSEDDCILMNEDNESMVVEEQIWRRGEEIHLERWV